MVHNVPHMGSQPAAAWAAHPPEGEAGAETAEQSPALPGAPLYGHQLPSWRAADATGCTRGHGPGFLVPLLVLSEMQRLGSTGPLRGHHPGIAPRVQAWSTNSPRAASVLGGALTARALGAGHPGLRAAPPSVFPGPPFTPQPWGVHSGQQAGCAEGERRAPWERRATPPMPRNLTHYQCDWHQLRFQVPQQGCFQSP